MLTQPGYQQGIERALWWKVAQHLDETHLAAVDAIAHNVDDPTLALAFQDVIRQAQATLLEIFLIKGLLPTQPSEVPAAAPPPPAPPAPEGVGALAGALPISIGVPAFSAPPPPSGWAAALANAALAPGQAPLSDPSTEAAAATISDALDYGEDAGKGFENQDGVPAAPEAEA